MLIKRNIKNFIITTYNVTTKVESMVSVEDVTDKVRNPLTWCRKHAHDLGITDEIVVVTVERGVRTYDVPEAALEPFEVDDTTEE